MPTSLSEEPQERAADEAASTPEKPPSPESPRSTTRRVVLFLVVLSVGLAGMYALGRRPRIQAAVELQRNLREVQEAPPSVNVVRPVLASDTTELQLPGETAAFYDTTIFARVNGYLHSWLHDIGDRVKEGELLATIDTPDLDQQLAEAQARVSALAADVHLAETQLDFAKITAERFDAAAPNGAVSRQERDAKAAEYKTAQAKLESAKAQLALGEATAKRLQALEGFKRVVAPFDGVITQRHIDIGSLVTAGSTSNTSPLFAIAQADRIRVYVKVPQSAAPEIQVGITGRILAREFPGQTFTGQVDRTAGAVDPLSSTLKVEVLVPNPRLLLWPGMYVQVGFQMPRNQPPLLIDAGALDLRPEGPTVAVVDRDDRLHFRKITVAHDLGDTVEVAEGLRPDDWVGLNVSDEIKEGEQVRPVRLQSPQLALHEAAPAVPSPGRPGQSTGALARST